MWFRDGGVPGVTVVETPIADAFDFSGDSKIVVGLVSIAIDPGVEFYLDTTRAPWIIGYGTDDLEDRAEVCRAEAIRIARQNAVDSSEKAGIIQGAKGQRILSVRVSDHCEHDPADYERRPCGHCYCRNCDGFVDPKRKTTLRSPGAVITCNRKPKPWAEYDHLFGENMAGSCALTRAMIAELKSVHLPSDAWPPNKQNLSGLIVSDLMPI